MRKKQDSSFLEQLLEKQWLTQVDYTFAMHMCEEENARLLLATLMRASRLGHICMPLRDPPLDGALPKEIARKWREKIVEGANHLPPGIHRREDKYYLERNFVFEKRVEQALESLGQKTCKEVIFPPLPEELNEKQKEAIEQALASPLSIITGGPGTGKTYTAAKLIQCFPGKRVIVAAPTGKAAAQLSSKVEAVSEVKSMTLHALLGIKRSDDFCKESFYVQADLLIVDECSMIDLRLFSALFKGVEGCNRTVLMGDRDQLPPVETGHLFGDLCEKKIFPTAHLGLCMRQEREELSHLADALNRGDISRLETLERGSTPGVRFDFTAPTDDEMASAFEEEGSFVILTPLKEGPFGVLVINRKVRDRLSQERAPIIITKTDYQLELYNGQVGIKEGEKRALFDGREIACCFLPPYEYAYALSIHKSQGCEYDRVLLIIPEGTEIFGREILYTAVTRARKEVCIRGSRESFYACAGKTSSRHSGLL